MKKYLYNILAVCMMLMPQMVSAQEKQNQRQIYEKAEEACTKAHFDWSPSVILRKMTKKLLRNMLACC